MAKKHLGIAMALFLLMTALPFAVSAQSGGVTKNTNTKSAPESKEVALTIEGKIYGGVFVFEGNTIRFNNMVFYNRPEDITVDGKPWKDVAKPFELDYTPDFGKAGILEKDGPRMFYVDVTEKQFSLRIENTLPGNHIAPFKVKLAMKNQLPHGNSAAYRPVPQKSHIQPMNDGAFYKALAAKQTELWDSGIKEHKIVLSGRIRGSGTFVFEGNTIQYRHEDGKIPDTVEINGRRWARLKEPFELPFQIETESLELTREKGENPVKLTQIDDKKFEVYFNDPRPPSGTHSISYSVTIAPVGRKESVPGNTVTSLAPPNPVKNDADETALTIEGKIYGGVFAFEGNTIRFNNMAFYNRPEDITVDGKPWKDVAKPFELDYTPDFGKAGILEKDGPRMFYVDVKEKQFSLRIENTLPGNHIAPFKVKLAMKNQLPHGNSAAYRPVPQKSHIQPMNDGAFYKALAAKQTELWDSGIKEHKLLFTGVIEGKGTFVFEGNTIRYRHETGKMPDMVKINGQRWARLKEPFELPFQVETESLQINKEEGGYPVTLTRIDDRTFEVSFDDRDPHGAYYSVAITPGAPRQSK